jgi:hypothetical protein
MKKGVQIEVCGTTAKAHNCVPGFPAADGALSQD